MATPSQIQARMESLARAIRGECRFSRRGVPHVVVRGTVSVCWFERSRRYRVFWPFGVHPQHRADCRDVIEVQAAIAKAEGAPHVA